ncbi:hypothetical protein ACTMU2_26825 [Cupriavidus basilensis]
MACCTRWHLPSRPLRDFHAQHVAPHLKRGAGIFTDLHAACVPGTRRAPRASMPALASAGRIRYWLLGGGSVARCGEGRPRTCIQQGDGPLTRLPPRIRPRCPGSEFSHCFGVTETGGPPVLQA